MLGATGQSKKLLCAVSIRVFSIGLVLRARGEVAGVRPLLAQMMISTHQRRRNPIVLSGSLDVSFQINYIVQNEQNGSIAQW